MKGVRDSPSAAQELVHLQTKPKTERMRQSKSCKELGELQQAPVTCAKDIIEQAGYPLEQWSVITPDGYILTIERIPRKGLCRTFSCSLELLAHWTVMVQGCAIPV